MNKSELIKSVASATGITQAKAGEVVENVLNTIVAELKNGSDVSLSGFGTFKIQEHAARKGFNPRTKAEIQIPAKKSLKFTAFKSLQF